MSKKIKKFIFPGIALITSFYLSIVFTTGAIVSYLGAEFFCRKFIETGKIKLLIFNFKNWQIHLHHWLIALLIIIFAYISKSLSLSLFWSGVLVGLIFHDIYTDRKWQGTTGKAWYQVVYKNPVSK